MSFSLYLGEYVSIEDGERMQPLLDPCQSGTQRYIIDAGFVDGVDVVGVAVGIVVVTNKMRSDIVTLAVSVALSIS